MALVSYMPDLPFPSAHQSPLKEGCLQRLIFISLIGRFNRTMTRYLSVGHIFTVNILYAT